MMNKNTKKRFLIIRGDMLGDVILSTALIPAIKDHYPDSEIYFLGLDFLRLIASSKDISLG